MTMLASSLPIHHVHPSTLFLYVKRWLKYCHNHFASSSTALGLLELPVSRRTTGPPSESTGGKKMEEACKVFPVEAARKASRGSSWLTGGLCSRWRCASGWPLRALQRPVNAVCMDALGRKELHGAKVGIVMILHTEGFTWPRSGTWMYLCQQFNAL